VKPASSFFRYTLGFLLFVSVSLAVTFAVSAYEMSQSIEKQTAAAMKALVGYKN